MTFQLVSDAQNEMFQSLPVSACLVEREASYMAANSSYAALFNASPENLVGKAVADFMLPEVVSKIHADFQAFDDGAAAASDEVVLLGRHFFVSINPIRRSGQSVAALATLTDISSLKKKIVELATSNQELRTANARIKALAETDALTGLTNRRGFERFLNTEMRRCRRQGKPISLALVDIDHFKLFNDRYGHIMGDATLKDVGTAMLGAIRRPGDCAARYGGEEFVVVLPDTDLSDAEHVCRNIQEAVARIAITNEASPFGRLTVSIGIAGVATISRDHDWTEVRDLLLQSADAALYHVKASGRNGVKVWHDENMRIG
ncbi:GGDEF domain-containing protein [Pseudochrobactrum sp. Wa41.01b-1]|uniref:GGDEF domain-containing protein n=1 Tax=Pseudochrobactrum sp. Wa41.01b-1 TaxID=2864102 RepID=UPI001C693193|nr:GGDEF domain-containing protein [Pseudochrobactrum sp. Wa41.01b-1]QYM71718.1 GGDEF domain-containing protein [Pseudochrobactrum sp. Wa41.01b-1]